MFTKLLDLLVAKRHPALRFSLERKACSVNDALQQIKMQSYRSMLFTVEAFRV
ncbi:MAG: hypothetical protein AB7F23_06095 [Phycisphaerae bacterium]